MSQPNVKSHSFEATPGTGSVSALLIKPADATCLYVLAHGAGAGMRHAFMEAIAARLAERKVATFRYQFPYMELGKRSPGPPARNEMTVRNAVAAAHELVPDLPLFAGGKSMGGRMTSQTASKEALPHVRGIIFLGFPLHAPGRDGSKRGEHLADVPHPMLFLQGTRDRLANLELLAPLLDPIDGAELHVVDGGDHSFKVPKRSGRTADEVMDELADTIAEWTRRQL